MDIHVTPTKLDGVVLIDTDFFRDERGFFIENYHKQRFAEHGLDYEFVQDNHSRSSAKVLRGLHYQDTTAPMGKLVRCTAGCVLDVAVDIRRGSPSYGRHVAVVLSGAAGNQLFVPEGFAHGFCTLEPNTEVVYKVNRYYSPEHDRGMLWNDPALSINWPVGEGEALLSDKDRRQPRLAELPHYFRY